MRSAVRRGHRVATAVAWVTLVGFLTWAVLALALSPILPERFATGGAAAFAVVALGAGVVVRPWRRAYAVLTILVTGVLAAFFSLTASNERDWAPDVARAPWATFDGDRVTLHEVRNFDYVTEADYTERWEDRTYDLSRLATVDLSLTYWGSPHIAHTIVSFGFTDGQYLAVSIETRRERTESYSATRGFFRRYELAYVFADERDLLRLRTNYRQGEDVYLFRIHATPERARALFLDYLNTATELARRPGWYNALTGNCTTNIRTHVQNSGPANPWSWQLLANGHLDELLYARGAIDTSLPLAELKTRVWINDKARAAGQVPDFSTRIRDGVPGMGG
ncbi:MAG: DUF4105 domain-containing protein [Deltaproteobacteria bacterium]|jgi:hypothetical protein|nr:DUF4105 domain-containing protein [Deltaproteobacteria bacterium]